MNAEIRVTCEDEANVLSEIRVRSKGHWGYSPAVLESWRPAMIVTRDYIRQSTVRSIFLDGRPVGFYALKKEENLLDHLWLLPEAIGLGLGRFAFTHAVWLARSLGLRALVIVSDVDAASFYLKMGAQKIGEVHSPHQNRMLPKLVFYIPETPDEALEPSYLTGCRSERHRRILPSPRR